MNKNRERKLSLIEDMDMEKLETACSICNGVCGICLSVAGEKIKKIQGQEIHPISKGYICPKGMALPELISAPERLKNPLIKKGGVLKETSWNAALSFMARRINEIIMTHGAETLAIHVGQAGIGKEFIHYFERLCDALGSPNFSTACSHCHEAKEIANVLTYGMLPVPDFKNSKCVVLWGQNPSKSYPPAMGNINEAVKNGAKLIVIDPRQTSAAKRSDIHLQLRPGTDGALALALTQVIISEGLHDSVFVDKWTVGFEELKELTGDYAPEKVEEITWVPAEKIREAARIYAHNTPACIAMGLALELQSNGFQGIRAIAALQAVCGNLDIKGGALFSPQAKYPSIRLKKKQRGKKAIGQELYPVFYNHKLNAQANIFSDAILEGSPYSLKSMIVIGSNPLLTWPNAGKLKKALKKLEFLVVIDHFLTESARYADIVLPAATFLSRNEIYSFSSFTGEPFIALAPKVLQEEQMTDWQICMELAKGLKLKEHFPWDNEEHALNGRLKIFNTSLEGLQGCPGGLAFANREEKGYEKDGFKTATGKVELYSQELKDFGYDPLPVYREPAESPVSTPEIAQEYPLIATTGARQLEYLHSRFRNLPSVYNLHPGPLLEVHPKKAEELNLVEGEKVSVESIRGAIQIKVKLTKEIDPRVIFIPHGWEEANANILTDNGNLDPVSGFPPLRAFLVRIVKL